MTRIEISKFAIYDNTYARFSLLDAGQRTPVVCSEINYGEECVEVLNWAKNT